MNHTAGDKHRLVLGREGRPCERAAGTVGSEKFSSRSQQRATQLRAEQQSAGTGAWERVQPNDMSDVSEARLCAAGSQSEASLLLGREGIRLRSSRSSRLELGQPMDEQMKAGTSRSSDELPAILCLTPSTGRHPSPSSTRSQRGP